MLSQIVNSVVMNHVVIEDGCHIQGSVVCNNVQFQERAVLKDCQVCVLLWPIVLYSTRNSEGEELQLCSVMAYQLMLLLVVTK